MPSSRDQESETGRPGFGKICFHNRIRVFGRFKFNGVDFNPVKDLRTTLACMPEHKVICLRANHILTHWDWSFHVSACIIVCRLAIGRCPTPTILSIIGWMSGPFVMVFDHLTGSNGCPRYSDSWIWPFVCFGHVAIYGLPIISFLFIRLRIFRAIAHFFRPTRPHLNVASFRLQVYVA